MKKPFPGILFPAALLFYCLLTALLVWGPALLTAGGNRMAARGNVVGALGRYEWLQTLLPDSPYLYHNTGVCQARLEKPRAAQVAMEKATALYWKRSEPGTGHPNRVGGTFYYQLGNIMMQSAVKASRERTGESAKFYQMALVQYKKALLANPGDVDAKYNYEIALLRLGQSTQEPPPNEDMRQTTSQNEEYLNQLPNELPPNRKDW